MTPSTLKKLITTVRTDGYRKTIRYSSVAGARKSTNIDVFRLRSGLWEVFFFCFAIAFVLHSYNTEQTQFMRCVCSNECGAAALPPPRMISFWEDAGHAPFWVLPKASAKPWASS